VEAVSAAFILERVLRPLFVHTPEEIPTVLPSGKQVPPSAQKVILMCTPGVLEQDGVIRLLASVVKSQTVCFPVVAGDGFQFPPASYVTKHSELVAKVLGNGSREEAKALSGDMLEIFTLIAVHFPASTGSQRLLDTQAQEIARRLTTADQGRPRRHSISLRSAGQGRPHRHIVDL